MAALGPLSRRRLIGSGAAGLMFGPRFARAEAPAATEGQPGPPKPTQTIQGGVDPQQRLLVETMIDGQGPFHFLVDTGADSSVLAFDVAVKLGLIKGEDVTVQGLSRAVNAGTVSLKNLSVGPIFKEQLSVPLLPREWLYADGYLGLDVLIGRRVVFDFQHHRLTIDTTENTASWAHSNEIIVRARGQNGRLTAMDTSVDGVHATSFIDTGAEFSIGNSALFAELQKNGATYLSEQTVPVMGVTGGQVPAKLMSIAKIRLGSLTFARAILLISDLQVFDIWGLKDTPALFIGMNFLKETSEVTLDYGQNEIRFKLADVRIASRF